MFNLSSDNINLHDVNDMKLQSIAQDTACASATKERYPLPTWPGIAIAAAGIIMAMGIVLRLASILTNRSLWMDEAQLAKHVVSCSWSDLLWKHLEGSAVAPQGFMLLEKLAVRMPGSADWVLRLVPLLAGMALLVLFFVVARRMLGVSGTLVGLLLVALSCRLAYYAAEIKQYSSDATMSLAILWVRCFGCVGRRAAAARRSWPLAGLWRSGLRTPWSSYWGGWAR